MLKPSDAASIISQGSTTLYYLYTYTYLLLHVTVSKSTYKHVYTVYIYHPLYITRQASGSPSSLHSNLHSNKYSKESIGSEAVKSVACISQRMVNDVYILEHGANF